MTDVSFRQYKLRPPADAPMDLRSGENDPGGLVWRHRKTGGAEMSIKLVPRRNPRQQRPWVASEPFMLKTAEAKNLLVIEAAGATTDFGTIGGMPFARIASSPSSARFAERWVKYVALAGNEWLIVDIKCPQAEGQLAEAFETAARTLRMAAPGEARAEPFAAERVAPRLADDPDRAAGLLRRLGPAAESAVAAQLGSSELAVRRQAARLLADIATEKSAPALRQAAQSDDDEVADAARKALRRVTPAQFDAVSEAVLNIKANRPLKRKPALDALAAATPDPARRPEVSNLLEGLLLTDKAGVDVEQVGHALAAWYTDQTVVKLLPLLDKEKNGDGAKRRAAMEVLAATRDKRAVMPIMVPWLEEDAPHAVPALIALGPVAEEEMVRLKVLWGPSAKARKAAAEVLEQTGTARSLPDLARASKDSRDPAAAAAAQQALDAVKRRATGAKPATRPGA